MSPIDTAYGHFFKRDTDSSYPPVSLILRGVNLSSTGKIPSSTNPAPPPATTRAERDAYRRWQAGQQTQLDDPFTEAESGGPDGWYVGHPLAEDGIDTHLQRLRSWGFQVVRLIVTWEALEHNGPGRYDQTYINYLVRVLRRCKAFGFRVFISPHQDVFSRFAGGSGAPYWAMLALGLNPRRIHQTGAAVIHHQWDRDGWGGEEGRAEAQKDDFAKCPDMIWNTNLDRLASRHCFTMFFASETFAPKCLIDGQPVGPWLRARLAAAYAHLARALAAAGDLLDTCVIGWDSMNEPHAGFIGMPDLSKIPPSHQFRKGPSPTPLQGFQLGAGQSVTKVAYDDFTSLGHKQLATVTMTPPGGQGVWLTRAEADSAAQQYGWKRGAEWEFSQHNGCVWAGHGVWDSSSAYYVEYIQAVRQYHITAISFLNPPVFGSPPDIGEDVKQGRVALSPHFYDGLTMLGKRRHRFNADAVGLQRGHVGLLGSLKVGASNIKAGIVGQFEELKRDAGKQDGIAEDAPGQREYPTLIGELGVPFDMKKTAMFGLAQGKTAQNDYSQSERAMDELLQGCDGHNALSYTIWDYEPTNTHAHGDGWNGEDLSLFSYDDMADDDDSKADSPADLRSLSMLGTRAVTAWCRPYPAEIMGRVKRFHFNVKTTLFELEISVISYQESRLWQQRHVGADVIQKEGWTLIYLPFVHYLKTKSGELSKDRVTGAPDAMDWEAGIPAAVDVKILEMSEGRLEVKGQWAKWFYPLKQDGADRNVRLRLQRWK